MIVLRSIVWRTLAVPTAVPVVVLAGLAAWSATFLARANLGADEGFVEQVRHGSLLFAGALVLSLAEPLELAREVRGGQLLLRAAHGGGFALPLRCLGLLLASLPVVAVAALASGGVPPAPGLLLAELLALCAGGLLLGAFLDRARLVPCLWALLVAGHVRDWILSSGVAPLAWLLPDLAGLTASGDVLPIVLWSAGALLLADGRLRQLVGDPA